MFKLKYMEEAYEKYTNYILNFILNENIFLIYIFLLILNAIIQDFGN